MKYCRKCDAKYFSKIDKCVKCGGGLSDGSELYKKKAKFGFKYRPPISRKTALIIVFIVAFVYAVSAFLGFSTGAAVGSNCREAKEYYLGEIPIEVDAAYTYYPKYRILGSFLDQNWNNQAGFYYNYTVILENTDSADYYYTVQYNIDTSNHGRLTSLVKKLVKSHENETFEAYFDTDLKEQADGKFIVFPEPVQKIGKAVRIENRTLSRAVTKCF